MNTLTLDRYRAPSARQPSWHTVAWLHYVNRLARSKRHLQRRLEKGTWHMFPVGQPWIGE